MREFNPNIFKRLLNLPFKLNSNENNCLNLHTAIYIHSQFLQFMKYKFMREVFQCNRTDCSPRSCNLDRLPQNQTIFKCSVDGPHELRYENRSEWVFQNCTNVRHWKPVESGKFGVKATKKIGRSWSSMMSKSDLCEMAISFCENSMRTLHEIYKAMKKEGFDSELRNLLFVIIGRAHRTSKPCTLGNCPLNPDNRLDSNVFGFC